MANEKADAIYEKKCLELEQRYQLQEKNLRLIIDKTKNEIQEQEEQLKSLKQTRAAAIEATKREKEIQDNKEDYCLTLPIEYSNDVKILRGVAKQIAKPRSILMAI